MKKTLITAALLSLGAHGVLGQGAIFFYNRATGAAPVPVVAPIYGPEANPAVSLHGNATTNGGSTVYSGALLSGTGFTAQLWASPVAVGPGGLAPISTTPFRTAPFAGFWVQPANPTVANAPDGSSVIFDVRVWDNRGGTVTSWAAVMADPSILHGSTGQFTTAVAVPPTPVPNLVGLTSFNLFAQVPEPSVIALGALGLGALLLRRRKA